MTPVLLIAGLYNLTWGTMAVLFPGWSFAYSGFEEPLNYPPIWQCLGMVIGLYGVGYVIAAFDPFRHWPIVLVGLLGKLFGPLGYVWNAWQGTVPASLGFALIFNDLIWWVPFALILWSALRFAQAQGTAHLCNEFDDPIRDLQTNSHRNLWDLSFDQKQLVVFLRHAGCTFCREALADLQQQRPDIERLGFGMVLVHLGSDCKAEAMFKKYGLDDVPRISDPECRLYRQFGLKHGTFRQLCGLKVLMRGIVAAFRGGYGFGWLVGNGFQMPGAFVIHEGRFLRGFEHDCAGDRINFVTFVREIQPAPAETSAVA